MADRPWPCRQLPQITNFWKLRLLRRIVGRRILKQDDIEYAIENTQVILAPERQIATFGNTSFEFHLISELMDRVDQVRIRTGRRSEERRVGKGCRSGWSGDRLEK